MEIEQTCRGLARPGIDPIDSLDIDRPADVDRHVDLPLGGHGGGGLEAFADSLRDWQGPRQQLRVAQLDIDPLEPPCRRCASSQRPVLGSTGEQTSGTRGNACLFPGSYPAFP
jgi:hypothetical protein